MIPALCLMEFSLLWLITARTWGSTFNSAWVPPKNTPSQWPSTASLEAIWQRLPERSGTQWPHQVANSVGQLTPSGTVHKCPAIAELRRHFAPTLAWTQEPLTGSTQHICVRAPRRARGSTNHAEAALRLPTPAASRTDPRSTTDILCRWFLYGASLHES